MQESKGPWAESAENEYVASTATHAVQRGRRWPILGWLQQELWCQFSRTRESSVVDEMEETRQDLSADTPRSWKAWCLDVSGVIFLVHPTLQAGGTIRSSFWAQKEVDLGQGHCPSLGLPRQAAAECSCLPITLSRQILMGQA